MSFHLHVSTNLETLAGIFRETIYESESGENPLHPVVAAVQTQGIATWLKQYIAAHSSIAMNLKMPFLKSAIAQTIREYYPAAEEELSRNSPDRDTWRIFHYLSQHCGDGEIPELERYLQNDPDMRKQFQISRQIAVAFEQYRTYRQEEMIQCWLEKKGRPEHWQEKIFRDLFVSDLTLDRCIFHFIRQAEEYSGEPFRKSLSVFGISSMPPMFLKFFLALAKYQDVHLFYLAPSADYWDNTGNVLPENSDNNPLLQALGVQGRVFFEELLSSEAWNVAAEEGKPESGNRSFLRCLQEDIRNNKNVSCIREPDGTVLIENCHTPLREIEILHDRILHEIREYGRKPGEILVTAPNIETYVPYIETVFGTGPLSGYYTIADRSLKDSGTILPALIRILHLPDSNYSNTDVFSLLEVKALRNKFHLRSQDIRQIRSWCTATGVRWGIDGEHREEKCGVNFEDFSWRQGVRRLLLGYAVSEAFGEQENLSEFPLDFAEGAGAEKLGGFLDFLDEIFCLREELSGKRSPGEWFEMLKDFPDRFFHPEESAAVEERSQLIRFLTEQAYESESCQEKIPFPVICDILEHAEFSGNNALSFLRGKITFCSMVPMRTIPMPVIAILGLNAGEFPRRDIAAGFNLIAKDVRLTDRSKNLEDRYLLLETLLAAGEKLFICYSGQSPKDNSEIFPTPPLAELIQYLERLSGQTTGTRTFLVKHRIQAYSDSYFDQSDPLKFSYSETAFQAAEAGRTKMEIQEKIYDFPDLSLEDFSEYDLPERVTLNELEQFFRSPAGFYLTHQKIGKFQEFQRDNPEEEELFQPDALSTSQLKREMIRYAADWCRTKKETSVDYRALREQLTKKVQLPCRSVGEELFANLSLEIKPILADAFLQAYTGQSEKSLEVKCCDDSGREILFCGTVLISGDNTTSCCFNAAEMKQRHCLNLWLRHLFLSAALPEYTTMTCQFEDQEYRLEPVEQSAAQRKLLELAAIREAGKVMMIPFFNEVEPVDETPNKKGQFKYEMEKYKDSVIKSISYDYNASLFFKKYDMDPAFMRKVCHAVNRIYEV